MSSIIPDWPTSSIPASFVSKNPNPVAHLTSTENRKSKSPDSSTSNVPSPGAPILSSLQSLSTSLMTPADNKKATRQPTVSFNTHHNTTQNTTQNPNTSATTTFPSSPPLSPAHAAALAKPVSFYEKKARQIHNAMHDIHEKNYTFAETAAYYNYKLEELGCAFATFGVQAMEITKVRNVYQDTVYRTMALNKEGYSTDIENALPKAFRQKKAESEGRHLIAGTLRLPRVNPPASFVRRGGGFTESSSRLPLRPAATWGAGRRGGAETERGGEKLPLPNLPGSKGQEA